MQKNDTIVITGAAGFIGSCLVAFLNEQGFTQLILVDDFSNNKKVFNLRGKQYAHKVHREQFFDWSIAHPGEVKYVFHLGARTDTTEPDYAIFKKLNVEYSKALWEFCSEHNIPMVYASSAATYGDGSLGYKDDHAIVASLAPLNAYGLSKNNFDLWALEQKLKPPFWAGLKFFNVYGPNEYHKGRMASVIYHSYKQIKERGYIKLFRSHNPAYNDGEQMRDFVYVKDVINVATWLMQHQPESGLYNLGTGHARSFNDLAHAIFSSLHLNGKIEYIDTPMDIRANYQYFTEADMSKLAAAGYTETFYSLEEGVADYLKYFLEKSANY
jgi:ADP-L-glycero-D-manno-heptose 6-epimerase